MTNNQGINMVLYRQSRIGTEFKDRYLNVPVNLLQGYFENHLSVLQKIVNFCVYQLAKERLSQGTLTERIEVAGEFLVLDPQNAKSIMYHGRNLYRDWLVNDYPRGGIKVKVLYDYANNQKSEFDKVIFCALIGLKSIIQKDHYKKTTFDTLFVRMAGYSTSKLAEGKIPDVIQKYRSRHYRAKIIKNLEDHWHFAYEADHTRGFYFSFRMSHEELCHTIQKKKLTTKSIMREKTETKNETRKRVREFYENREKSDPSMSDETLGYT
jgi:hypothetical protein